MSGRTLCFVASLLLLSLGGLQVAHGEVETATCEDVTKLPAGEDRCAFAREHCTSEGWGPNYLELYYCRAMPHGTLVRVGALAAAVGLLALLFRVIARTSDDFFSCILSQISQDMGLPPRLGGVTLLALGNGAPDLSACIAAVRSGNYRLALGALTGAGMFVGCVVAGRILTLNGGAKARWAQIRDVSFYLLAAAVVTVIVASGQVTYGSVMVLLLLYCGYVVIVAVADFSKRMGVEWPEVARNISRRLSRRGGRVELAAPLLRQRSPSPAGQDQLSDVSSVAGVVAHHFYQGGELAFDDRQNSMEMSSVPPRPGSPPIGPVVPMRRSFPSTPTVATDRKPGERQELPVVPERSYSADLLHQSDRLNAYLRQQALATPPGPSPLAGSTGLTRGSHTLPPHLPRPPTQHGAVQHGPAHPSSAPPVPLAGRASSEGPQGDTAGPQQGGGGSPRGRHRSHSPTTRRALTLPVPGWLHPLQHPLQQPQHLVEGRVRRGPTVAAFQPRVPYEDLVRMPAREYRQRALAEMAQSRSFYARRRRRQGAGAGEGGERPDDSEGSPASSESEGEEGEGGDADEDVERGRRRYTPPQVVPSLPQQNGQQQQQPPRYESLGGESPPGQPLRPLSRSQPDRGPDGQASEQAQVDSVGAAICRQATAASVPAQGSREPALGHQQPQQQQQQPGPQPTGNSVHVALPGAAAAAAAAAPHHPGHTVHEFAVGGVANGAQQRPSGEPGGRGEGEAESLPGPLAKVVAVVEAPIMTLIQATVPLVEPNAYQRHWFITSMACSPLFICLYLGRPHWLPLLAAAAVGAGLGAVAVKGTEALGSEAPIWDCGTQFPIGAALVALYGFAVAAMWISVFASEIVELLHFLGVLSGIDPGILGLTVLAWGNSLMDYVNNVSMAGKSAGGNSMAMTACYAGPLFNMLIGLGLGFWSLLNQTGADSIPVELPLNAALGFGAIMTVCAAIVVVALVNNHWLPQKMGWAMVGWYAQYLAVVLLVTAL